MLSIGPLHAKIMGRMHGSNDYQRDKALKLNRRLQWRPTRPFNTPKLKFCKFLILLKYVLCIVRRLSKYISELQAKSDCFRAFYPSLHGIGLNQGLFL